MVLLVFGAPVYVSANEFAQNGDRRWLAVASTRTEDEAIGIAKAYRFSFASIRVVQASNGWYAVVAGPEGLASLRAKREQMLKSGSIPKDSLFSRGDGYVRQVWAPSKPLFDLEFKFEGGRPVSRRVGDLVLTVLGRATDGTTIPVLRVLQDSRIVFQTEIQESATPSGNAEVRVLRLDPSASEPQIVFSSFSGGAHCCTVTRIVTRIAGQWRAIDGRTLDGDAGYSPEDIDGDGAFELVSIDNSFLYRFASYADSHAPTRIERLVGDRIVDVTRDPRFQAYLRQDLYRQEHWAALQPELWRRNGFLGGWLAAKALVGQFDEAWSRMTGLYERNSDWTMTICSVAEQDGKCPKGLERDVDFPTALRHHLETTGYIPPLGRQVTPPKASTTVAPSAPQTAALPPVQANPPPSSPQPAPERRGSTGTGFFASVSGHVVTNAHVVTDCRAIRIRPSGGAAVSARIVARDAVNDLALLETEVKAAKFATIRSTARLGESVAVFGFPLSQVLASSGNFTLGNITALAGIGDDTRFLQISAPVQPGNSGGPLLDESGNVIGVVTSKLNALRTIAATGDVPQNVNFAIRASALTAFLESRRITGGNETKTVKLSPPDLADEANAMSVQVVCE